jgi:hypothetical protein
MQSNRGIFHKNCFKCIDCQRALDPSLVFDGFQVATFFLFLLSNFAVCIPINSNYLWRVRSHYNLEKAFEVPISNLLNVQSFATLPYFSGSIH